MINLKSAIPLTPPVNRHHLQFLNDKSRFVLQIYRCSAIVPVVKELTVELRIFKILDFLLITVFGDDSLSRQKKNSKTKTTELLKLKWFYESVHFIFH